MAFHKSAIRCFVALLLLRSVWAQGQVATTIGTGTGGGTIDGIVLISGSSGPIPQADITLVPQGSRGSADDARTTTGGDGRFRFETVKPGTYNLQIRKLGYFSSVQNATRYMINTPITIAAQQHIDGLEFRMVQGGVIKGRVVDEKGQPLVGVPMSALSSSYSTEGFPRYAALNLDVINSLGNPAPRTAGMTTNDKGEYRLFWLPPGSYYVRADYNPNGPVAPRPDVTIPQAITTYFPDVNSATLAKRLAIRPGEEITADIQVRLPKSATISGQIVEKQTFGAGTRSYRLYLIPRNRNALTERSARDVASVTMRPGSDGKFTIPFVSSGEYYLVARNLTTGYGQTPLDVGVNNIDNVTIEIKPPVNIKLQVTTEGDAANVRLDALGNMGLRPELFDTPWASARIGANGSGEVTNLAQGRYVFQALPSPGEVYIVDARQGDHSVLNEILTIGPLSEPIQITVSSAGGHIEGVVRDVTGKPTSALVTAVLQGSVRMAMTTSNTRTSAEASGHFSISGLPPGEYRFYAWEDIPIGAETNKEFMSGLEKLGTALKVEPNGRYNLALPLITREAVIR